MRTKSTLLVSPTVSAEESPYFEKPYLSPCLGLWRLKAFLESKGVKTDICDTSLERLSSKIVGRYDVLGISTLHSTIVNDLAQVFQVKRAKSEIITVMGGQEASFNYETLLEGYSPPLDFVVLGEGEYPLLNILRETCDSAGVAYRGSDGRAKARPNIPLSEEDFVKFTKAICYEEIPYKKYWRCMLGNPEEYKCVRLYTSNRCPYGCSFCSSHDFVQGPLVALSAQDMLGIVRRLISAHAPETIFMQDDTFTMNRQRTLEFCRLMKHDNIDVRLICQTRPDYLDRELLVAMRLAGFKLIGLGVESFSQRQLNEFRKGFTVEQAESALHMMLEEGITPFVNTILSSQNTTMQDVKLTLDKLVQYAEEGCEVGINIFVYPYHKTAISKHGRFLVEKVPIPNSNRIFERKLSVVPNNTDVYQFLLGLQQLTETKFRELPPSERRSRNYSLTLLETYEEIKNRTVLASPIGTFQE